MSNKLHFTLPLPPSVNTYQRYRVKRFGRKTRVEAYPSEETEQFYSTSIEHIRDEIQKHQWKMPPTGQYIIVEATFYLSRLKSDADNYFKCTLDSLEKAGIVCDDSYIIPRAIEVYIDKDNPRVELNIYVSEKVGVFANKEEMEEFKKINCSPCKRRGKDKCVVFRGFVDNRSHALGEDNTCKEKKE